MPGIISKWESLVKTMHLFSSAKEERIKSEGGMVIPLLRKDKERLAAFSQVDRFISK